MKNLIVRLSKPGCGQGLQVLCSTVLLLSMLAGAQAADRQILQGHVLPVVSKLKPMGRPDPSTQLTLAIGLPLRNREGLTNLLRDLYTPGSPYYHQYLTVEEFTQQFGPTEQDYEAVAAFARSNGLTVTASHPNRMLLNVSGSVADVEKAFQVTLHTYQHPTEARTFYAPDSEPSVEAGLSVLHVGGLNNYIRPYPRSRKQAAGARAAAATKAGSAPGGAYLANDFRAAFVPGTQLTGAGQAVGLFQADGYYVSDIQAYEALAGLTNVPLTNVLIDGATGGVTDVNANGEVSLDIEMVMSMAPGVSQIIVYEGSPMNFNPEDVLNRMATDNAAKVLSSSWGWSGGPNATIDQIFQQMQAQGQTFFNASGDSDAFPPGAVDDATVPNAPSDSPYIMQVGGTTLTTTGPGGAYVSEKVWNWGSGEGSSGGMSSYYSIPSWQQGVDMSASGGSTTMRNLPDVALVGDNVYVIYGNGQNGIFGGTSCAAPLWAGFTALVNQQAQSSGQPPVGFLNPALYAIGNSAAYTAAFHDITQGDNTWSGSPNAFFAVPGFDLCSGWGTPAGSALIDLLAPPAAGPVLVTSTNAIFGGNGNGVFDPNECNGFLVTLVNIGSAPATGIHARLSSSTPGVVVTQPTSLYPSLPPGSAAANLTAFQVSTGPNIVCGSSIELALVVKSDQGIATNALTLQVGLQGVVSRFDNPMSLLIPDNTPAGISSPVVVSNISSAVSKVAVSLYLSHPLDAELQLSLIGPDGTTCLLAANNGGFGQNFGAGCSPDSARTTFDDAAGTSIAAASAPFVGTFQPVQPLAIFAGKSGTNVNGTWQLHVVDQAQFDVGAIQCWSLLLSSAGCTDGGGTCPGVDLALGLNAAPTPVFLGSNLVYTITVTNFGPSVARGVSVSQQLPASAFFLSASASQGTTSFSGGTVGANLGAMDVGTTATVTVTVTPTALGQMASTATVSSLDTDVDPSDNTATVSTLVAPPASDLAVGLAAAPNPALVNGTLTYSVSVTNFGPSVASGVTVSNLLPSSVAYSSGTASQGFVTLQPGNVAVCNFGALDVGRVATATIQVVPGASGTVTATATASANQNDPLLSNNSASVSTVVGPAADLEVSVVGVPNPVVRQGQFNYQIKVVNHGPSIASSVVLNGNLGTGVTVTTNYASQGSVSVANGVLTGNLSALASGASATVVLTATANTLGTNLTTVSVASPEADPNPANNSASTPIVVANPFLAIVPAGASLVAESFSPPNGAVDIGETVTVSLSLANLGNAATTNLVATLLPGNGVTQILQPTQGYGQMGPSGTVTYKAENHFTFTAAGTNGGTVTATLQVRDVGGYTTNVSFAFALPSVVAFANTNLIIIPDSGPAAPYPSAIQVAGVNATVSKVTATLSGLSHTYPHDVNVLLVGPTGASTVLMAHAGDQTENLNNVTLTFDDAAPAPLPAASDLFSGSWQPTAYSAPSFPTNAPVPPYPVALAGFNGVNPNGTWSLYVYDDSPGDQGQIANGWSLAFTTVSPITQQADLGLTGTMTPNPAHLGDNLVCSFVVSNAGPATANGVAFTNVLPATATLVAMSNSLQADFSTNNGLVTCGLGNLSSGAMATVTFVLKPSANGWLTNAASVAASEVDVHLGDNALALAANVVSAYADLGVSQTLNTDPVLAGGSDAAFIIAVTNAGPNAAVNVLLTNLLPPGFSFVSATPAPVAGTNGVGALAWNLGNLDPAGVATITLNAAPVGLGVGTNLVAVSGANSMDTNLANNSASLVVTNLSPVVAAGVSLVAENFSPPNGAIDPGERVSVSLALANDGVLDIPDLQATLLPAGGITSPSGAQSYGTLAHGGAAAARTFSFTAGTPAGGLYVATLALQSGTNDLGTVAFSFVAPSTSSVASGNAILIPDHGAAAPYPALLNVSGLTGIISKVTVTLNGFTHAFPSDVSALLVNPAGASALLMSHCGGGFPVSNITFTVDDAAGAPLPGAAPLSDGGVCQPAAYNGAVTLPGAVPAPYGASLAALNGSSPNGTWKLYVFDDSAGDAGNIASGWTLHVTTVQSVNPLADLAVRMTASPASVFQLSTVTYTITVTNQGPSAASGVVLSDVLPAGVNLGTVTYSQGGYNSAGGMLTFNVGPLAVGAGASATVRAAAAQAGSLVNTVQATLNETDLNPANNTAQTTTPVLVPRTAVLSIRPNGAQFEVTITAQAAQTYQLQATTNLRNPNSWSTVTTIQAPADGIIKYVTTGAQTQQRYYRAVRVP